MSVGFSDRCDAIEECYEFMLAYAGQGLSSDEGSQSGGQVREFLHRAIKALTGMAESCAEEVEEQGLESSGKYQAFMAVLDRDAPDSLAAFQLVLAPPPITSHLIHKLNTAIHLRALLTHLFLFYEIPKAQPETKPAVPQLAPNSP